jgi:hypothetical protein
MLPKELTAYAITVTKSTQLRASSVEARCMITIPTGRTHSATLR